MEKIQNIAVIGAGLSGPLMAIMLANRGYKVSLYERRPDMRLEDISAGRSINLAFSNRGIAALDRIGMATKVLNSGVPMKGRLIHDVKGETNLQPYSGRENECIYSISRGNLNIQLMNEAERLGIPIYFNHKCNGVNQATGSVSFINETDGSTKSINGDIVIGADGAGSAIRKIIQEGNSEFQQTYEFLEHGYKELNIQPGEGDQLFRLKKNVLHIWPRGGFMLIALPNEDGSFTVTLFLAIEGVSSFSKLNSDLEIERFFNEQFGDVVQHIPNLIEEFKSNPTGKLGTVKCYPWQFDNKYLVIGDAAHAVVPFYGQGMNCSFEDCLILDNLLNKNDDNWIKTLEEFQNTRKKDADAIADLAIENFYEMRDHVADENYVKVRQIELKLEAQYPDYYSKYSLVTFQNEVPYSEARRRGLRQNELLFRICQDVNDIESLDIQEVFNAIKES